MMHDKSTLDGVCDRW